jgi:hypothetical protein
MRVLISLLSEACDYRIPRADRGMTQQLRYGPVWKSDSVSFDSTSSHPTSYATSVRSPTSSRAELVARSRDRRFSDLNIDGGTQEGSFNVRGWQNTFISSASELCRSPVLSSGGRLWVGIARPRVHLSSDGASTGFWRMVDSWRSGSSVLLTDGSYTTRRWLRSCKRAEGRRNVHTPSSER